MGNNCCKSAGEVLCGSFCGSYSGLAKLTVRSQGKAKCVRTEESSRQVSGINLQQPWRDQKGMTLGRESQDPLKLGTSFLTWLNTDLCRPVGSSWKSSPQLLGLLATRRAFETNMGIMTHWGKHGLLRRSEGRLWTERQVSREAVGSFTWIKLSLAHLRNLGWVRWVVFQGGLPRSMVLTVLEVQMPVPWYLIS